MNFGKSIVLGLLITLLLVLGGCSAPAMNPAGDAQSGNAQPGANGTEAESVLQLKMSVAPYLTYAGFYIALEEGFFAAERLEIEPVQFGRSATALPALASGELDLMGSNLTSALLNTIVRDGDIRIVASTAQEVAGECATGSFLLRTGLLAEAGGDLSKEFLQDLRYFVGPAAISAFQLDQWLQQYDLSLDDVTLLDLPNAATTVDMLQQGTLDFASLSEPWSTRVRLLGAGELIQGRNDDLPDAQLGVLLFGPTLLHENADAGERFMRAYLRGVRQLREGPTARNLAILQKHLELEPEVIAEICWPYIPLDGRILYESVETFSQWATGRDYMDRPLTSAEFWDARFVDAANRALEEEE